MLLSWLADEIIKIYKKKNILSHSRVEVCSLVNSELRGRWWSLLPSGWEGKPTREIGVRCVCSSVLHARDSYCFYETTLILALSCFNSSCMKCIVRNKLLCILKQLGSPCIWEVWCLLIFEIVPGQWGSVTLVYPVSLVLHVSILCHDVTHFYLVL